MNLPELKRCLHDLEARHGMQSKHERLKIAQMLMRSARKCLTSALVGQI